MLLLIQALFISHALASTIEEAKRNPKKYIFYDTSRYKIMKHALDPYDKKIHFFLACAVTYGILIFFTTIVCAFSRRIYNRMARKKRVFYRKYVVLRP